MMLPEVMLNGEKGKGRGPSSVFQACSKLDKSCAGLETNKQKWLSSASALIGTGNKLIDSVP